MTIELYIKSPHGNKYKDIEVKHNVPEHKLLKLAERFYKQNVYLSQQYDTYYGWRKINDNSN